MSEVTAEMIERGRGIDPRVATARRKRRASWFLIKWGFILTIWGLILGAIAVAYFAWDLPRPEAALDAARLPSLTLADSSGHIYAAYGDVVG